LSHAERKIIEPVLIKYAGIFHDDEDNDFKSTNVVVHKIETGDATPIKKAPYKTPFALRHLRNLSSLPTLYKQWLEVEIPNRQDNRDRRRE